MLSKISTHYKYSTVRVTSQVHIVSCHKGACCMHDSLCCEKIDYTVTMALMDYLEKEWILRKRCMHDLRQVSTHSVMTTM